MTADRDETERTRRRVREIIGDALGLKGPDLGPHPAIYRTAGWDSLSTLEIVIAIEAEFDIQLPDEIPESCCNLDSLVELVEADEAAKANN